MPRALGLRRKAAAKVLPWALITAAIVPAAWTVALTFVETGFNAGPFGNPAEFFEVIGMMTLLFVALVAPTLLIPDRLHGVLAIYASRPVRASDYLLARAAVLVVLRRCSSSFLTPFSTSASRRSMWMGSMRD